MELHLAGRGDEFDGAAAFLPQRRGDRQDPLEEKRDLCVPLKRGPFRFRTGSVPAPPLEHLARREQAEDPDLIQSREHGESEKVSLTVRRFRTPWHSVLGR